MSLDDGRLWTLLRRSFDEFGFYRVQSDAPQGRPLEHTTRTQKCFLIPFFAGTELPGGAKMDWLLGSRVQSATFTMPSPAVTTNTAVDFMLAVDPLWTEVQLQPPLSPKTPHSTAALPSGAQVLRIVASELHSNFKAMAQLQPSLIMKAYSTKDPAEVAKAVASELELSVDARFHVPDLSSPAMIQVALCAVGQVPVTPNTALYRDVTLQQLITAGAVQLQPVSGRSNQYFIRMPLALLWRNRDAPHFSAYAASPLVHPGLHFEKLVFQHLLCRLIGAGVSRALGDELIVSSMFPAPWTSGFRVGLNLVFEPLSVNNYDFGQDLLTIIQLPQNQTNTTMSDMTIDQWKQCIRPLPTGEKFAAMTAESHPLFDAVLGTGNVHLFVGVKGSSYLLHKPLHTHGSFSKWCENAFNFATAYKAALPGIIPVVIWVSIHPVNTRLAADYRRKFSDLGAMLVIGAGPAMFAPDAPFGMIRHRVLDGDTWYV